MLSSKWLNRLKGMAFDVSEWSEDDSTKVGAVTFNNDNDIHTFGWNGIPRGIDPEDFMHERPEKYFYYEHAERNAVYNAGRLGISLKNTNIIVTHFPCPDCARAIIQSGIKKVYFCQYLEGEKWEDSKKASEILFSKASVEVVFT